MLMNEIVQEIQARCQYEGKEVTDILAAFVARTMVQENTNDFYLNKKINDHEVSYLIKKSVQFLLENNNPSLETIKMQMSFDLTYIKHEEEIEMIKEIKNKKIKNIQRSITSILPNNTNDMDTLTNIYRQIFTMLMISCDAETKDNRMIEKEIAASLESVFPRIGLKSFINMSIDDKKYQLNELIHIIGGIRLFNKEINKGGFDIVVNINDIEKTLNQIIEKSNYELNEMNQICTEFTEYLLYITSLSTTNSIASNDQIKRWQLELINRRQFLSYLKCLDEEIMSFNLKLRQLIQTYNDKMISLKELIGSKKSVPKEQVYPIFENLSQIWINIYDEYNILNARSKTHQKLLEYKNSYISTFSSLVHIMSKIDKKNILQNNKNIEKNGILIDVRLKNVVNKTDELDIKSENDTSFSNEKDSYIPERIFIDTTPEFMQLPLEYQGYCPVTMIHKINLLLPGDPSYGIVKYKEKYYVFLNEEYLIKFIEDPNIYINNIIELIKKQPQLIYLLRLQDMFPEIALSNLVKTNNNNNNKNQIHPLLKSGNIPQKVDASTSTPTHFIEKNIDVNYEWNEWAIRRRALKLTNLRKCATVSSQTILSNFRRQSDTQVYLPRNQITNTRICKGTNPIKKISYFAGLRGSNHLDKQNQPQIVQYTLDL